MPSSSRPSGERLVKVGFGRNQAEAELIQGLLRESGIQSIVKRSRGFDVPDFLAAGPRDVLVPERLAETARKVLTETMPEEERRNLEQLMEASRLATEGRSPAARLALWLAVALVAAVLLTWALYQLSG